MITVVFLHSHDHFIPGKIAKHQFSSSNLIATEIYETLNNDPNVSIHYFDIRKIKEWRKIKADFLITLVDNLKLSIWYFKPGKVILIGVNKHPLLRLKSLAIAKQKKLPQSALSGHDGIYEPILPLRRIDYLVCIGNNYTFDSYKRYFDKLRIVKTHYNSKNFEPPNIINSQIQNRLQRNSILVSMSSIGFRKNYDFINELLKNPKTPLNRYDIYVIGSPATPYWASIIDSNKKAPNFNFMGYIEKLSAKSRDINLVLTKIKVALVPTLEDASPGSMLDLINSGVLCLHNQENSGVQNTVDALHSDFLSVESVIRQIDFLMQLDEESFSNLQRTQQLDLKKMFNETYTFTKAIKYALYDNSFTENYTRVNYLRIFIDYIRVPLLRYPYVFLRRFYRNVLVSFNNRLYLILRR
jgi:hypothetical protein